MIDEQRFSYICNGDKFAISVLNTIALPVPTIELPQIVEINGNRLVAKSFFHVSLVCVSEIIRKNHTSAPNFKDLVLQDFCEFTAENEIEFSNFKDEYKFVEENDLKSIVVMCDIKNLDRFFELINKKYNLHLEYPPTHVTLYTLPGKLAIFLTDQNDIKELSKPISNPIGRTL